MTGRTPTSIAGMIREAAVQQSTPRLWYTFPVAFVSGDDQRGIPPIAVKLQQRLAERLHPYHYREVVSIDERSLVLRALITQVPSTLWWLAYRWFVGGRDDSPYFMRDLRSDLGRLGAGQRATAHVVIAGDIRELDAAENQLKPDRSTHYPWFYRVQLVDPILGVVKVRDSWQLKFGFNRQPGEVSDAVKQTVVELVASTARQIP